MVQDNSDKQKYIKKKLFYKSEMVYLPSFQNKRIIPNLEPKSNEGMRGMQTMQSLNRRPFFKKYIWLLKLLLLSCRPGNLIPLLLNWLKATNVYSKFECEKKKSVCCFNKNFVDNLKICMFFFVFPVYANSKYKIMFIF